MSGGRLGNSSILFLNIASSESNCKLNVSGNIFNVWLGILYSTLIHCNVLLLRTPITKCINDNIQNLARFLAKDMFPMDM